MLVSEVLGLGVGQIKFTVISFGSKRMSLGEWILLPIPVRIGSDPIQIRSNLIVIRLYHSTVKDASERQLYEIWMRLLMITRLQFAVTHSFSPQIHKFQ